MIDLDDFKIVKETRCSRKLYRIYCDNCRVDRGYQRRMRSKSKFCRSCFGTIKYKNKIVSSETRSKMSKSSWMRNLAAKSIDVPWKGKSKSIETRALLSIRQKQHCEKHGNQFMTGKSNGKHTSEVINRLSAINSGKEPRWSGRVFMYDGPKGSLKMRSSYELIYANWMDTQKIDWTYEPKYLLSDGRTFSPDFQLSTGDIIEVKGYWTSRGKDKWDHFCEDYPQLKKSVVTKDDLIKLGLKVR